MKKGVFEKGVRERVAGADLIGFATEAVVSLVVAAAVAEREAAGVVWDPEEELPERVQITPAGNYLEYQDPDGSWKLLAEVHCSTRAAATARELVRRHGAWKALEKLSRWHLQSLAEAGLIDYLARFRAILDGKEGE